MFDSTGSSSSTEKDPLFPCIVSTHVISTTQKVSALVFIYILFAHSLNGKIERWWYSHDNGHEEGDGGRGPWPESPGLEK